MTAAPQATGHPLAVRVILRLGQIVGVLLLVAALSRVSSVVSYAWDAAQMRDWEVVRATILETDYRAESDENENEMVFARYRYEYQGAEYEGTRVDVSDSPDFIHEFQQQMWRELAAHLNNGTPIDAYVDPAQPDEAVLYPRFYYTNFAFRLLLTVVLAFAGAAFFLACSSIIRRENRFGLARAEHPDKPWLWRDDWASKRICASGRGARWMIAAAAAIYLLIVLPLGLLVVQEWDWPILSVPGVILIVVGWGLFNFARLRFQYARRYEQAELQLAFVPGVIGGPLSGVVHMPAKFSGDKQFQLRLECVRKLPSAKDRSESEDILWREGATIEKTLSSPDPYRVAIPVYFAIPFDCQPSDPPDRAGVNWRLKVGTDTTDANQHARFEVPVYQTAESSEHYEPDPSVLQPYEKVTTADDVLRATNHRVTILPGGGEEISFKFFQTWALLAAIVILALCFGGIAAILHFEWHAAFTILPGFFALLVVLGMSEMLLWSSRLQIHTDSVTVTSGLLGFRKTRRLLPDEIQSIESATDLQMERTTFYAVILKAADGQTFTLVKRLESRHDADLLADWLREKLPEVPVVRSTSPAADAGVLQEEHDG